MHIIAIGLNLHILYTKLSHKISIITLSNRLRGRAPKTGGIKMKKLVVTVTALAMLTMSLLAVSASETGEESVSSNMDAATYLELRTSQLDEALNNGEIDDEQYALLMAHIEENLAAESFGRGPQGYLTAENEECVLGEDGNLGIFRNENAGQGNGQGNGVKNQKEDGTGEGTRGGNRGNGGGKGSGGNNGMRLQDGSGENEECILDL